MPGLRPEMFLEGYLQLPTIRDPISFRDPYPFLIRGRSKIRVVESDVDVSNSVPASRISEFLVHPFQSGTVLDSSDVTQDFPQSLTRNIFKCFSGNSRLPNS